MDSRTHIAITEQYGAHNYSPVAVVIADGNGAWVKDVEGKKYLDMLSAYSAVSFGHSNERLIKAAKKQLDRITLTSRAFYNDQLGLFFKELAELCGMEVVLPMNSGAEAVETAIKTVRKWGYEIKGVHKDKANIICFKGNFHGRTTTIVSFCGVEKNMSGFGPFTPGFSLVDYGNIDALRDSITKDTVAVLIEPIQGEAGVVLPSEGYLQKVRELCSENNVLMVADEIQTGLCRTGEIFACQHEGVQPDVYILGKALAGGITPLSAVVSTREIMQVFTPGIHGSTFGGNPLACAIALEVIKLIKEEKPHLQSKELGNYFLEQLRLIKSNKVSEVRGKGLFIGVDIKPEYGKAKEFCHKLMLEGVLSKDTRDYTMRFAPPLCISKEELDWGLERIRRVLG